MRAHTLAWSRCSLRRGTSVAPTSASSRCLTTPSAKGDHEHGRQQPRRREHEHEHEHAPGGRRPAAGPRYCAIHDRQSRQGRERAGSCICTCAYSCSCTSTCNCSCISASVRLRIAASLASFDRRIPCIFYVSCIVYVSCISAPLWLFRLLRVLRRLRLLYLRISAPGPSVYDVRAVA